MTEEEHKRAKSALAVLIKHRDNRGKQKRMSLEQCNKRIEILTKKISDYERI